jgi:HSP20 family protein
MAKPKAEQVPVEAHHAEPEKPEQSVARREATPPSFFDDPFGLFNRFDDEVTRLFGDFGRDWMGLAPRRWTPAGLSRQTDAPGKLWMPEVEVLERDGKFHVKADLPGVAKEDVHVEILDNFLTLRGERKQEHVEKKEGYYRSERSYGSFLRRIPLPKGIEADKATATFKDGVLEIVMDLPKRTEPKGRKLEIT